MLHSVPAFIDANIHVPTDFNTNFLMIARWIHFLAGITWIGLLYFFNLVNVPFQKELDAATKGKVVPLLMPRALYWFRHSAALPCSLASPIGAMSSAPTPATEAAPLAW